MKYVRFIEKNKTHYGILKERHILRVYGNPLGIRTISDRPIPLSEVQLTYPCVPRKIIGVAINYKGATGQKKSMKEPLIFLKPSTSLIGHNDYIESPFRDVYVWGESELAIVIKKRLCNVSKEDAKKGIFGYAIANDISARNLYDWDHHLARSKGADSFCALGPYIDTEFDPRSKTIEGFHNEVLIRRGSTDDRLWKDIELVSLISSWMTLEPWDVILTGAPPRVRERIFFKEGDTFTVKIESLGEIKNKFRFRKNPKDGLCE